MIWPNGAGTPPAPQKRFNDSRSFKTHQTEDIKSYVQASAMIIVVQGVAASRDCRTRITRVGRHHENRQTRVCFGEILQEGCECEGHFMRSDRNSQRKIRNRSFTAHGLARYITIKIEFTETDETESNAVPLPPFGCPRRRPRVCTLSER